ncbi:MAG TPA: mandelate racemase/muconate lactonizing enzyme family protein, partial [Chloroflexota bacterium]|nr:mandelate racemase/muconate lactonizing enzyme family protein [Chloroflexota bacterium]
SPGDARGWLLVEVETDDGVTGVGECSNQTSIAHLARGIEVIRNYLIGRDPAQIEAHWQRIYHSYGELNPRGYITHLLSAIDIALWDIKGKVLGVPIYELLGGPVRDRVPLYTHVPGPGSGTSLDRLKDYAREAIAAGYEALKTDPFPSQLDPDSSYDGPLMVERLDSRAIGVAVEWMEALREASGPDFELLVDAHARFDTQSAILGARALEPIELIWYEEPTHLESNQALKQIRESTRIPLCVGEHHFTRWDFVPVLEERLVDYIMPDVAWCGGISEWRRIASVAEPNYIRVSPHDAIGPVAMVASFHVAMATANLYRQEIVRTALDTFSQFIMPMPEIRNGAMLPSDRPGLGIELNHDMVRRHLVDRDDPVTMWPSWRGLYRGLPGGSPIGGKSPGKA